MNTDYQGHSKKSGVYQIRNLTDGKVYVGSTKEFKTRKSSHQRTLRKGTHHNKHLLSAFQKYGEENFIFEVLEVVEGDRAVYSQVEQKYIDQYLDNWEQCYNFDKKAVSSPRRVFSKTPEESKFQLSESLKESWADDDKRREKTSQQMKQLWEDSNHRQAMSEKAKEQWASGILSRQRSEESKRKISQAKGALITIDGVSKASTQWAEHSACVVSARCIRRRIQRGWDAKRAVFTPNLSGIVTEEHKARISMKNKGRKHTKAARKKMREAKRRFYA